MSIAPHPVRRALNWLGGLGSRATETYDERLQRRLQLTMALASVPVVALWGLTFVLMGHPWAMWFHAAYCLGTLALVAAMALTDGYRWFRWAHPALVLLAPYTLHWYLGGFRGSGGAFLWPLVAPIAAMLVLGKRSRPFFIALCGLLLISGLREGPFAAKALILTPAQISLQFAFNAIGVAGFIYLSTRYFVSRIDAEKGRAERLLHNILPASIAERLKREEGVIADRFESVTVLFSDIVGFTPLSARLAPRALVLLLDSIFSGFDDIAGRLGLEKIKTIGDAYMLVGGLPTPTPDHAAKVAEAALAMREFAGKLALAKEIELSMRIGIHSGEVVAGVIGTRKFSYDLWGDTVNTASRMESHSQPGRIQISAETRALLGEAFRCEERGTISVKGKGEMRTFWLAGRAELHGDTDTRSLRDAQAERVA